MRASRITPYTQRHIAQRSANDADQTEFMALTMGSAVFEQGIYDDRIADSLDDFDPGLDSATTWQRMDLQYEGAAGSLLEQIQRRRDLLGDFYPFSINHNSLEYCGRGTSVYEFCLAVCNAQTLSQGEYAKLPRLFERLSCELIKTYLGNVSESIHTGWPRERDRPKRFKDLILELRKVIQPAQPEKLREWFWRPEPDLPEDPDTRLMKDEGVDFIAWKPHFDDRGGNLYMLGQCACGGNWLDKFHDINIKRLEKWFHPMTLVEPIRAFCTPYHVTDNLLIEASREAGIIFDRVRLTSIAEDGFRQTGISVMQDEITHYIKLVIDGR